MGIAVDARDASNYDSNSRSPYQACSTTLTTARGPSTPKVLDSPYIVFAFVP